MDGKSQNTLLMQTQGNPVRISVSGRRAACPGLGAWTAVHSRVLGPSGDVGLELTATHVDNINIVAKGLPAGAPPGPNQMAEVLDLFTLMRNGLPDAERQLGWSGRA